MRGAGTIRDNSLYPQVRSHINTVYFISQSNARRLFLWTHFSHAFFILHYEFASVPYIQAIEIDRYGLCYMLHDEKRVIALT
jgi:hypothetical protein